MRNDSKKTNSDNRWPTVMESVEQSIKDMEGIVDVTETMRRFNKLKYEAPKEYTPTSIVNLRKKKLRMSQQVFANVCNIKLPTLQKWERGYSKPTPPVNRLFQIVEKGGLGLIRR
ncbi:MAG: helix-turn-helix domain-containing protein [Chitinivibrionales bacterium]